MVLCSVWQMLASDFGLVALATATNVFGARRAVLEAAAEACASSSTEAASLSMDVRGAFLLPALSSASLTALYLLFAKLQSALVVVMAVTCASSARFVLGGWCLACGLVCAWLTTSHWVAVNALGCCACITCVALVRLPSLRLATLCLGALVAYDIFWVWGSTAVFGENVMVRVVSRTAANPVAGAPSLELPIKLIFPSCGGYQILGLGDIAVPGLVVALAARFDAFLAASRPIPVDPPSAPVRDDLLRRRRRPLAASEARADAAPAKLSGLSYATIASSGYAVGLLAAAYSAHHFGPQPALVFLGPAALVPVAAAAAVQGHFGALWGGFEDDDQPGDKTDPNAVPVVV